MTTITFNAPMVKLSLNDRLHWARKAEITRAWRTAAFVAARNAGVRDVGPSLVQLTFSVRDSRRRDAHNLAPTCKAAIDGLVDAGVFPDDHTGFVALLDPIFAKRPGTAVDVTLTPMEVTR